MLVIAAGLAVLVGALAGAYDLMNALHRFSPPAAIPHLGPFDPAWARNAPGS